MRKTPLIVMLSGALIFSVAPVVNSQSQPDTSANQPKKGGMFGKLKGLAHNKTAQSIAKVAACTALPGGQYVVGALDAKQQAAKNAVAGAATSAVGAATGTSCMPGMSSGAGVAASGMTGGSMNAATIAAMSNARAGGAAGAMSAAQMQAMMAQMQALTGRTQVASNGDVADPTKSTSGSRKSP